LFLSIIIFKNEVRGNNWEGVLFFGGSA